MQPQEPSPLWVWLTIWLTAFSSAAIMTGYLIID